VGDACDWRRDYAYHILAFDHALMRVAYARIYKCTGSTVVAIRPAGDIGLFSTTVLAQFLSSRIANFQ
jgi:hypothetical protein